MKTQIPTTRPSFSRWAAFVLMAVVVAFSAALMTGCAPSPGDMTLTDENGCKWTATIYNHENGDRYGEIKRVVDAKGLQICKAGAALMVGSK